MALEDTLERLVATLTAQNETNKELLRQNGELLRRFEASEAQTHQEFSRALATLEETAKRSISTEAQLVLGITGLTSSAQDTSTAAAHTAAALARLADQSQQLESAATQAKESSSRLAELIELVRIQTEQQTLNLKYQNESIETNLRLAKESSRSTWVQNWLFFFLGVSIPIIVQLAFKLL
jgi:hypothetical protein